MHSSMTSGSPWTPEAMSSRGSSGSAARVIGCTLGTQRSMAIPPCRRALRETGGRLSLSQLRSRVYNFTALPQISLRLVGAAMSAALTADADTLSALREATEALRLLADYKLP